VKLTPDVNISDLILAFSQTLFEKFQFQIAVGDNGAHGLNACFAPNTNQEIASA